METKAEEIIKAVHMLEAEGKPIVDARFGENWKESVRSNGADFETALDIAWHQGRRAILFEKAIKDILN